MRRISTLALLIALAACNTTSQPREPVPAMQMPPRPEATGRIVIFRLEEDKMKGYAPALLPAVSLNGENLGEFPANTLSIRDVVPGEYQITVANASKPETEADTIKPLKAALNAGDEWYIETGVKIDGCQGPKTPSTTPRTGVLEVDALTGVFDLLRVAHMAANTTCASSLQLEPAWPQTARWRLNPLLQKQGAKPLEPTPDNKLPNSGMSWRAVESAISNHFALNRDDYKPHRQNASEPNLYYQDAVLISEQADNTVVVDVGYLQVVEPALAGLRKSLRVRYALKADDDRLVVTEWQLVDN